MSGCKIHNNSDLEVDNEIYSLVDFTQDRLGFQNPPTIFLDHDEDNSQKTLGKTGYYDPETMEIHVYVTGRHPKDILRSIAHELVHHFQNEKGELTKPGYHGQGYAQKNPHLRNMELQANDPMLFRDWEDSLKENQPTIYNEWRIKNMSTKQWKNQELNKLLLEKFGLKQEYYGKGKDHKYPGEEDEKSEKKEDKEKEELEESDQERMDSLERQGHGAGFTKDDQEDLLKRKYGPDKSKWPGSKKQNLNEEEEENEIPDKDKDGVPDWADKKPGKDDHEEKEEKKDEKESTNEWKNRQLNENLNKRWGFSMNLNKLKK